MTQLPDTANPNTSNPTVLSRLYDQEAQLRAQIAAAQVDANKTDPDGTAAAVSITAGKTLPGLQDSYRLILNSIASIEARPATPAAKGTPNTIVYVPGTTTAVGLFDSTGTYRDLPNAAAADKPTPIAGNTTNQFILTRMPNGDIKQEVNPDYQVPTSTAKPAKGTTRLSPLTQNGQTYTVQEIADGMGGWSYDPSYKPQVAIGKETPGNLVPINDPSTGKPFAMRDPVTGTVTLLPKDTATTPGADAYQTAQTENLNAGTAKTLRDMQPAGAKAIQDMYDSIGAVQGMMEKGTMTPAEASAYMEAFKQNLLAAQQGSTPWEMKTDQQAEDRNRADIGRQLLNQKLSSSSGMAQSLIGMLGSSASRLADIPGGVHFDPFGMAAQFTDQQSGGQEMTDLAKSLLGTLKPGAQPAAPPTAAPAASGGLSGVSGTYKLNDPHLDPRISALFEKFAKGGDVAQGQPNLGYTFNPGTPASIPGGLGGQAPASSGGMFTNPGGSSAQQAALDPVMQTIIQMLAAQPDLKMGLGR